MDKKLLLKIHKSEIEILDEIDKICKKYNINYFLTGGTLLGAVRHKGFIPWDDDLDVAMPRNDYEKFINIAKTELSQRFLLDDITTNKDYWLIFAKVRLKNTIFDAGFNDKVKYYGNKGIWVDIFPFDETKHYKDKFIAIKWKQVKMKKALYKRQSKYLVTKNYSLLNIIHFFIKPLSMKKLNKNIKKQITKENNKNYPYLINYGSQYGVFKQTHLKNKIFPLSKIKFEGKEYPVPKDYDYFLKNIYGENYMKLPPKEKRVCHNPKMIKFEDGEEVFFD